MAGRGCEVVVAEVTTGAQHALTVGLHTPLTVFKAQLEAMTGIAPGNQVLQLLDLRPPEERDWKDPDNKLLEDGYSTLRQCGFTPGCRLSLHSLGPTQAACCGGGASPMGAAGPSSSRRASLAPSETRHTARLAEQATTQHVVSSRVTPARADHSFAGVIFDVHARSHHEVIVNSLFVGGMLGRVRVFARDVSWRPVGDEHRKRTIHTGWGTRYDLDKSGWDLVADEQCAPSWDTPREIRLAKPVVVSPHHTRALFVHSNLPDDLGIQYQTYAERDVIAQDEHVEVRPGLGFTGSIPFDARNGWYRAYRGLAGSLGYTARPVLWSPARHGSFPASAQRAAVTLIAANQVRDACVLASLPKDVLLHVLERCHWDWFLSPGSAPPDGPSREGGGMAGCDAWGGDAADTLSDEEEEEEEEGSDYLSDSDGDAF